MPRKTYRTYTLKSQVLRFTKEDETVVEVVFRGGIQVDSTAKYSTRDPEIQEFLENSSCFGRDFYIESVEEDAAPVTEPVNEKAPVAEPEPEEPLTDVKDSRRFRNLVEMRNAIKELGIEIPDDANYMQAKAIAHKEGYDFQIQK